MAVVLLAALASPGSAIAKDPLDAMQGTEDWERAQQGGATRTKMAFLRETAELEDAQLHHALERAEAERDLTALELIRRKKLPPGFAPGRRLVVEQVGRHKGPVAKRRKPKRKPGEKSTLPDPGDEFADP